MANDQSSTVPFAGARMLPVQYQPCKNTVVLGRGKKIAQLEGNTRLRMIVNKELKSYTASESNKTDKSFIIRYIMKRVQENSLEKIGFVKKDNTSGRWYAVSPTMARATIAQAFRDANFFKYRSSKQAKQLRRLNASSDEEDAPMNLTRLSATPSLCRSIPTSTASVQKQYSGYLETVRGSLQGILDEAVEYIDYNLKGNHPPEPCLSEDPFEPIPFSEAMSSTPYRSGGYATASAASQDAPNRPSRNHYSF